MKKGFTELVFILDRSGSMNGLEKDTIGGFNSLLEKQKKEEKKALVSTVLFDDKYELLHDRIDIHKIKPITNKEYYVRGSTALLDAVGITINRIINAQKNTSKVNRAEKIMFVIITDGYENSSKEYSYDKVRKMIRHQKNKYGWEFIFLGANIDAINVAENIGINKERATNFHADSKGIKLNYDVICETVSSLRSNNTISSNWKRRIEEDYKKRKE